MSLSSTVRRIFISFSLPTRHPEALNSKHQTQDIVRLGDVTSIFVQEHELSCMAFFSRSPIAVANGDLAKLSSCKTLHLISPNQSNADKIRVYELESPTRLE